MCAGSIGIKSNSERLEYREFAWWARDYLNDRAGIMPLG